MNAPLEENTAAEAGHQLVGLKKTLEEATQQIGSLQTLLATQQHLEQLLKQGRAHLHEMRSRLQQATSERDELQSRVDGLQVETQQATAERERLAVTLREHEERQQRMAQERAEERKAFERMLEESAAHKRDMAAEIDEQRQVIQSLREAAGRAQSLAREIVRAHEDQLRPAGEFRE